MDDLRKRAEAMLQEQAEDLTHLSPEETQRLIHELQVHQIELGLQNEDLHRIQTELEASRNRYADLYDFAPVGYLTVDENGLITQANLTCALMLGRERRALLRLFLARLIISEDEDIYYLHRRKILDDKTPQSCEIRIRRKDDSHFYAHLESVPVLDDEKHVAQLRISITDISARTQAEEALKESEQQLRVLNANKDTFFSIIAHDVKNPCIGFLSFTDLLEESVHTWNKDRMIELIALLRTSAEHLSALLDNLLTLSRIQRGMIEHHAQPLDLHLTVARNIALFRPNAEHKQISLSNSIPQHTMASADVNMLDTVLRNLLSNALKFTPTGGTVDVSARYAQQYVEVSVSDTGLGIAEEHLPKLFRIDARYKRLGTAREKGAGLGLILCQEFVEKNGGKIWVESEVGKGTTFTFSLPKMSA